MTRLFLTSLILAGICLTGIYPVAYAADFPESGAIYLQSPTGQELEVGCVQFSPTVEGHMFPTLVIR